MWQWLTLVVLVTTKSSSASSGDWTWLPVELVRSLTQDDDGDLSLAGWPAEVGGGPRRNPLARTQKRNLDESAPLDRSSPRRILTIRSAFRRAIVLVLAASPYVCIRPTIKTSKKRNKGTLTNESFGFSQQVQLVPPLFLAFVWPRSDAEIKRAGRRQPDGGSPFTRARCWWPLAASQTCASAGRTAPVRPLIGQFD